MIQHMPWFIEAAFLGCVLFTILVFFKATHGSKLISLGLLVWIVFQTILASTGFYQTTTGIPPRFLLMIFPPFLLIIIFFLTPKGKAFIDGLSIEHLTLIHIVRIPVELVLYGLFLCKTVPIHMTFEGWNYDIIAGITAPIVYYLGFGLQKIGAKVLLIWNVICLGLLLNIIAIAILSSPVDFQRLAFDQPNIAVLYIPFNLLPAFIVPIVLFSHLIAIRRFLKQV